MARSKDWETYPEIFHDLLREACTREITVKQASSSEARKLMGRLYAFNGSLKAAAADKETPELARELATISKRVRYRIEGTDLVAAPRDTDPVAPSILEALGQTSTPLSATQISPSSLLAGLAKKGDELLPDE